MKLSKDVTPAEKEELEKLAGEKLRTEGRLDVTKAKLMAGTVAHCQVVRLRKKAFINILLRGQEGERMMEILQGELNREGTRKGDAGPPRPIHKEIKESLEKLRRHGGRS